MVGIPLSGEERETPGKTRRSDSASDTSGLNQAVRLAANQAVSVAANQAVRVAGNQTV